LNFLSYNKKIFTHPTSLVSVVCK